jgi:branched-chain amino acid aminotransferase
MAVLSESRWGRAMHNFLPIAYFEDQFIPFGEAKLSIATHALHYGTGAFGGLRGIPDPQNPNQILLFRLDRHCDRLSTSARFLNYDLPASKIMSVITDFVKKNQPTSSFYIRPFVYTSDLGIAPRLHNIEHNFFVYGLELGDYLSPEGVSCRISSWYRQEDRSLPLRGKISGAYITSSLAKTEAVESGFDEAILMNSQGKVSEASGMNVFVVRQGKLITPGFEQDILEGITRDSILTVARNLGIPVVERPIDKTELAIADEVFLSGTAAKITPVRQVENYKLSTHRPITDKLREKLTAITENRDPDYKDWVYTIPI